MKKERNLYLDVLKAVCIIFVILGHSIQYGSGMEYLTWGACLYNPVFIFIYSFHMPLFMLISGYLFAFSCKSKSSKELLVAKAKQILLPLFAWSFVSLLVHIIKIWAGVSTHKIGLAWIFQTVLSGFWGGPWFLWAIWWSSFIIIIGRAFLKDHWFFYLAVCLLSFVTPDFSNTAVYKFMFPYFLLAYLFGARDYKTKLQKIYTHKAFGYSALLLFVLFLRYYNFDSFIYTTGYTVLGKSIIYQLHINGYRFFIGFVGSVAIMCVVHAFFEITPHLLKKALAYIGTATMGIYLVSNYFFDEVLKYLPIDGLHYAYTAIETVLVLGISLLFVQALKSTKFTNRVFLGGR